MPSSVDLGPALEAVANQLVKSGRFNSRSEIIREGVRLIHERETRLAALDASIARGIADIEQGRSYDPEDVLAEIDQDLRRSLDG